MFVFLFCISLFICSLFSLLYVHYSRSHYSYYVSLFMSLQLNDEQQQFCLYSQYVKFWSHSRSQLPNLCCSYWIACSAKIFLLVLCSQSLQSLFGCFFPSCGIAWSTYVNFVKKKFWGDETFLNITKLIMTV